MSDASFSAFSSAGNATTPNEYSILLYGLNWNVGYNDKIMEDDVQSKYARKIVRQRVMEILFSKLEGIPQILLLQEASLSILRSMCKLCCIQPDSTVLSTNRDSETKLYSSLVAWEIEDAMFKVEIPENITECFEEYFTITPVMANKDRMASILIKPALGPKCKILITSYHAPRNKTIPDKGILKDIEKAALFTNYLDEIKATTAALSIPKLLIGTDTNVTKQGDLSQILSTQQEFLAISRYGKDAVIIHGFPTDPNSEIKVSSVPLPSIQTIIDQALESLNQPHCFLDFNEYKQYFDHQPLFFKIEVVTNDAGRQQMKSFHAERKMAMERLPM